MLQIFLHAQALPSPNALPDMWRQANARFSSECIESFLQSASKQYLFDTLHIAQCDNFCIVDIFL